MLETRKLSGKTICLDLSSSIAYKKKKSLIDLITTEGGKVTFILTPKTSFVVKDDKDNLDSYKCRMAFKRNLIVVGVDYIMDLVLGDDTVDINNYSLMSEKIKKNLSKGMISCNLMHSFYFTFLTKN